MLNVELLGLLPFKNKTAAWRRIRDLQQENKQILDWMHRLTQEFKSQMTANPDIYLSIQQIKSGTVYVRWRRRGVNGQQAYLLFSSIEGKAFLQQQSDQLRFLYRQFNDQALQLNLAYSLRLYEAHRIERFLHEQDALKS
jgi:hypothetical protein